MQQAEHLVAQLKPVLYKLQELQLASITPAAANPSADIIERLARANEALEQRNKLESLLKQVLAQFEGMLSKDAGPEFLDRLEHEKRKLPDYAKERDQLPILQNLLQILKDAQQQLLEMGENIGGDLKKFFTVFSDINRRIALQSRRLSEAVADDLVLEGLKRQRAGETEAMQQAKTERRQEPKQQNNNTGNNNPPDDYYDGSNGPPDDYYPPEERDNAPVHKERFANTDSTLPYLEREVIRVLIEYGNWGIMNEDAEVSVTAYILDEMEGMDIETPRYKPIYELVKHEFAEGNAHPDSFYTGNDDRDIANLAIELLETKNHVSENWFAKHKVVVPEKKDLFVRDIQSALLRLKQYHNIVEINKISHLLRDAQDEKESERLMKLWKLLMEQKKEFARTIGNVIYRPST